MRPEDPELTRLLDRFVPVRLTDFKPVDMTRFQFDYDLTFAILMMNADGRTYSRYGTQDWRHSEERMSVEGLKHSLRAVLAAHARGAAAPAAAAPKPAFTVMDIPAYAQSPAARQPCAHCHHANNFRFQQLRFEGTFRKEMVYQYPLPENLGLTMDSSAPNRVRSAAETSPAGKAGIRAGDVVTRVNDTPIYTDADLQFALNPLPEPTTVTLHAERAGKPLPPAVVALPAGWRKTDVSWRPSVFAVGPALGFGSDVLDAAQKQALAIPEDRLALRVKQLFPAPHFRVARPDLRVGDIVLGLNGEALPASTHVQFMTRFRLGFEFGQRGTLEVLRSGQRLSLPVVGVDPMPPRKE